MLKIKEDNNKLIKTVFAVVGILVVVAAIAFAVYKFFTKCKCEEEEFVCDDTFEDEESCIELEFVCPTEQEVASDEAEEVTTEEPVEEEEA